MIRSLLQKTDKGEEKYITGPYVCAKELLNACSNLNKWPDIKETPHRTCVLDEDKRYNIPNEPEELNLCFFDKNLKNNLKNTFENESWDFDNKKPKSVIRYYSKRFTK